MTPHDATSGLEAFCLCDLTLVLIGWGRLVGATVVDLMIYFHVVATSGQTQKDTSELEERTMRFWKVDH